MDKTILLASFIFPERLDWFINYLGTNFNIEKNKIYCFKNLNDESKFIITFKLTISKNKHLNLKNLFPNAIIIHKKGSTLYTINALNKLVETVVPNSIGNIDYKSVKIEWANYENKFILIDNKELVFYDLERIF